MFDTKCTNLPLGSQVKVSPLLKGFFTLFLIVLNLFIIPMYLLPKMWAGVR